MDDDTTTDDTTAAIERGWDVEGDYGHGDGWEVLTTEPTRREAMRTLNTYRSEEGTGRYRIRRESIV